MKYDRNLIQVGDRVVLPDGREGTVKRHLSRLTVEVERDDGKREIISLSKLRKCDNC